MARFASLTLALALSALVAADSGSGTTTRYWDCCKPSCAWNDLSSLGIQSAVTSCDINDQPLSDTSAQSGCAGGNAYMCSSQSPWAVSSSLAYGFAAVSASSPACCQCYKLTFTSTAIAGKTMIVQATNTGSDVGSTQFDIAMPGGGFGIYDGCTAEWAATSSVWGAQYGGSSTDTCPQFPAALRPGCDFRWDWFQGADNPSVDWETVACPAALTQKSGCVRIGDTPTGSPQPSTAAAVSAASSPSAASSTAVVVVASSSSASTAATETPTPTSSAETSSTKTSAPASSAAAASSTAEPSSAAPAPTTSTLAAVSPSTTPLPPSASSASSPPHSLRKTTITRTVPRSSPTPSSSPSFTFPLPKPTEPLPRQSANTFTISAQSSAVGPPSSLSAESPSPAGPSARPAPSADPVSAEPAPAPSHEAAGSGCWAPPQGGQHFEHHGSASEHRGESGILPDHGEQHERHGEHLEVHHEVQHGSGKKEKGRRMPRGLAGSKDAEV